MRICLMSNASLPRTPHEFWRMPQEDTTLDNYGTIEARFIKCCILSTRKIDAMDKEGTSASELGYVLNLTDYQRERVRLFWNAFTANKK
jgi:hypothetical protein